MQVLDQEYCNLCVERVALYHTGSALATPPTMLWQAVPLNILTRLFVPTY